MGSSDPSIFKTTCHSQLIYPGILRGGPRVLLPEDPIVRLLKFNIFESMMVIYSIGYHWTYYFHYLTERQYLPIRLTYFKDYKRVSLDTSLKRCRVDVESCTHIDCNGSEVPFNNTNLFSIVPDGDPRNSPPYFLRVKLIMIKLSSRLIFCAVIVDGAEG